MFTENEKKEFFFVCNKNFSTFEKSFAETHNFLRMTAIEKL